MRFQCNKPIVKITFVRKWSDFMNRVQPIRNKKLIAEFKKQLKCKDDKYYIMFTIGINSGLRISDILTLKVGMVSGTHINIVEKKINKPKRFQVNEILRLELERYVTEHKLNGDDYLIQSRKGINKPITRVQAYRVLNETAKVLGIPEVGTHTLRKTFGYWNYK
jgi:integrase